MDPREFQKREETRVRGLIEVLSEFDEQDAEKGISDFLTGRVRNYNPSFCPTAPQIAVHIRSIRDRRLDLDQWGPNAKRTQLLPPPEKSNESRQRVRQLAQGFARDHSALPQTAVETPEQARGWLDKRRAGIVSQGVRNADGDGLAPKGDIPVSPQLREILKRDFPIDG